MSRRHPPTSLDRGGYEINAENVYPIVRAPSNAMTRPPVWAPR